MIQNISYEGPRIETGPVQFGEDWPGLFIRGDNAFGFARDIDTILACADLDKPELVFAVAGLRGLRDMIDGKVILNSGPVAEDY